MKDRHDYHKKGNNITLDVAETVGGGQTTRDPVGLSGFLVFIPRAISTNTF